MDDDRPETPNTAIAPVAPVVLFQQGLEIVQSISLKLQRLDGLMLTAQPDDIAAAASALEHALHEAAPTFSSIAATINGLGANNLQAAARQLRQTEQDNAAGLAELLRNALAGFGKRSANASRRAQHLNRGLNAALTTLQAIGVQEAGRLIAEA